MKKAFTFLLLLCALHTMAAPPTTASSDLNFNNIEGNRLDFFFTPGNGTSRIVVVRQGSPVQGMPANGAEYTANSAFGTASAAFTVPSEYVVAKGAISSVSLTNLQPNTAYYIAIFEYNGAGSSTEYQVIPLRSNHFTAITPRTPASNLTVSGVAGTAATLNWVNGSGTRRLVIIRKNSAVNFTPQDLQAYDVSNYAYTTYNQLNGDNYAVYKNDGSFVTVTNLDPNQLYYYKVFEFNGISTPIYGTGTTGSFTTTAGPTVKSYNFGTSYVEGNSFYFGFSDGNGSRRLVVASKAHAITATPVNGQSYIANSTLGQGQQIAPDEYVVYDGDGTYTLPLRGLEPNIAYHFGIFDYDQSAAGYKYYLQDKYAAIGYTAKTPTVAPSNFSLSEVTGASLRINFTRGNGLAFAGLVKEGSAVDFIPQDLTKYRMDYTFGYGQQSGNGNYWTLSGNGNQAYLTGLKAGLTYHIALYETNGNDAPVYSTAGVYSFTTPEKPLTQASNVRALFTEGNTLWMGYYEGTGSHRIVIARKAAAVSAVPVDGTVYVANDTLGKGTEIAPGNFVVYNSNSNNVMVKGLEAGTTYYFTVFEYNISGITGKPSYLITGNQIVGVATLAAPATQMHLNPVTNITTQSARINFTRGSGSGRYIIMRQTGASGGVPAQYNRYIGTGTSNGFGWAPFDNQGNFSIARGNITDLVDVTNLRPNTSYTVLGYEYNGDSGPVYKLPGDSITFTTPEVSNAPTAPTQAAYNGTVSQQEGISLQLQWTNGNGAGRLVVMKKGSPVTFRPQNADEYTANAVFGTGTNLGDGQYVVFNGTGNTVQLTNLLPSTTYYYAIYEYNGTGTLIRYLTATSYTATAPTAHPPTQPTTNVRLYQASTTTSIEFNWMSGNGTGRLIVMREGSPVTFTPTDLTTYPANRQFGMNSVGGNQYMVYNNDGNVVTVTGLDMTKTYYFQFFEYNGTTAPVYRTSNNAQGTVSISVILPMKWVSFTAKKEGNNAVLNWVVTDEVNVAGYEVETSLDGRTFSSIRQLNTKPAAASNSYQAMVPQTAATVYYRIRQNDKDGKSSYSGIVKMSLTDAQLEVKVYPNPATDFISVQSGFGSSKSQVSIYTAAGQKVVEKIMASSTEKIAVQQLPAGTYFVIVQNGTQSSKGSFIKQ